MASRSILILRHPWKFLKFSWAYLRYLLLALADRLLFPFACRPISLHTETARCYLGASLSCFVELIFSAPPGLGPDDFIDSYRSLLFDYGIPAAKIFFGGDSAGGWFRAAEAALHGHEREN